MPGTFFLSPKGPGFPEAESPPFEQHQRLGKIQAFVESKTTNIFFHFRPQRKRNSGNDLPRGQNFQPHIVFPCPFSSFVNIAKWKNIKQELLFRKEGFLGWADFNFHSVSTGPGAPFAGGGKRHRHPSSFSVCLPPPLAPSGGLAGPPAKFIFAEAFATEKCCLPSQCLLEALGHWDWVWIVEPLCGTAIFLTKGQGVIGGGAEKENPAAPPRLRKFKKGAATTPAPKLFSCR